MSDKRYRVLDNPTTAGAGVGYKVEKVAAPRCEGSCFANMGSAEDLSTAIAMNPEAGYHTRVTRAIVAAGKVRDTQQKIRTEDGEEPTTISEPDFDLPQPSRSDKTIRTVKAQKKDVAFGRGMTVRDTKEGRKGVIIQASVGYTKTSHTPVHRICDSKGRSWLGIQSNLKVIA